MKFLKKELVRTLERKTSNDFPAKDAVYRFLNQSTFSWRRFLTFLSHDATRKVPKLTTHDRPKVLILDYSPYDRNCSKSVELLARFFDHVSQKMRYYNINISFARPGCKRSRSKQK